MLYVAVETDESSIQPGGHVVVGFSKDIAGVPTSGIGSTQLCFDTLSGSAVTIQNEIQYYKDTYSTDPTVATWGGGTIDGVSAGYTSSGGTYIYEIAIPLWADWRAGEDKTKQTLSGGDVVYLYSVMEDTIEGGNGTNLTWDAQTYGSVSFYAGEFDKASALTLVAPALLPGDANGDGMVDVGDLGILAANYGLATGATWALGDFNGDSAVDVGDLGILAANYGTGSSSTGNFDADYSSVFEADAEIEAEPETFDSCSALGLPLIAGLLLTGLMLIRLED